MSNEQVIIPMLDATMHIMEHMQCETDFLIVAAFSADKTVENNSFGQFITVGKRVSPFDTARMLHSMLVQFITMNQAEVMRGLAEEMSGVSEEDASAKVREFISQMGMKPN